MMIFSFRIASNFEDYGTEATTTPSDCAELLRIVILPVDEISLIEDRLRFFQTQAMLSFDFPALLPIEPEPQHI